MPKAKTHKATVKRFKITKNKKLMKKTASQDHFNAREPGKITRNKRRLHQVSKANLKNVVRGLPYLS